MQIESLAVIHIAKRKSTPEEWTAAKQLAGKLDGAFCLESCQRWLWVTTTDRVDEKKTARALKNRPQAVELYTEKEAYDFLLRVATGLESEVVGETDVFGQLKEAWKTFEKTESRLVCELHSWFQKLFEDTKEIRSLYMQDLGGASYGSLVRKVLKARSPSGEARPIREKVLVIGAGQIAQSIAPWLLEYDLLLWNRSAEKLETVKAEIQARGKHGETRDLKNVTLVIGSDAEKKAWMEATHVVICIPTDISVDPQRMEWWKEGQRSGFGKGQIIHLGGLREQCGDWLSLGSPDFHALDDLFRHRETQDAVRSRCIRLARLACDERAKLRVLGGLSIPHGWEDLMGFASDRELALSWTY